jgi:hypothetical protein
MALKLGKRLDGTDKTCNRSHNVRKVTYGNVKHGLQLEDHLIFCYT